MAHLWMQQRSHPPFVVRMTRATRATILLLPAMYCPCTALVTVTATPCETSPREAQDPLRARHTVGLKRLRITDDSTALISGRAHNHTHMHCQHNTCHITNKQRLALANAHLFSASQHTNQCNQLTPHAPLIDPRRLSNTIPAVALNWINQNKIGCMRSRHSLLNKTPRRHLTHSSQNTRQWALRST